MSRINLGTMACIAAAAFTSSANGQGFEWSKEFCKPGASSSVDAMAVYDDGTGAKLYAAGGFGYVGAVAARNVARWNGTEWSALPASTLTSSGFATTMTVFNGPGPLQTGVYVVGRDNEGTGQVQRWDGAWHSVPVINTGRFDYPTASLIHNDGFGDALYVGIAGQFGSTGVRRWNGEYAETLANARVFALASFDDGTGPGLYAGGDFTEIGGVTALHVARWTPAGWEPLGSGLGPEFGASVSSMTVYDDGAGPALYVAGGFTTAGAVAVEGLAKWTRAGGWSAAPAGAPAYPTTLSAVTTGGTTALYVGGDFVTAGGVTARRITKLSGGIWSALGEGLGAGGVKSIASYDAGNGSGAEIYAGGPFSTANNISTGATGIARFDGAAWSATAEGFAVGGEVRAYALFNAGDGNHLYASGQITSAGGVPAGSVIKWTGAGWEAIEGAPEGIVHALLSVMEMTGPALYAAGAFATAGGGPAANVARWDGAAWTALGAGTNGTVYSLEVFDDGTGPALYAGGSFTMAGGSTANRLARWNGTAWSRVGSNPSGANATVYSLKAFGGAGPAALYIGGAFSGISGTAASTLARWNGAAFSSLGTGGPGTVRAMTVQGTGTSARLWIGGAYLVSTDGLAISSNGFFMDSGTGIYSLLVADDGTGEAVYVGGDFRVDSSTHGLARTYGSGGAILPLANTGNVYALAAVADECTQTLFAGGAISSVDGTLSLGVAARSIAGPGPAILSQPISGIAMFGGAWEFSITAVGGELAYRWYKGNTPLVDDANLTGTATNTLHFAGTHQADTGIYSVTVTNSCGQTESEEVYLLLFCPAEFNFDFVLNPDDLADFITGFFASPPDPRTDFDQDGTIDPDDLADYVTAYFAPC